MSAQPERVTPQLLRSMPLPGTDKDTDKNSRGTVVIAGGSMTSPGGVVLSGLAALRAGAGKVSLSVPRPLASGIAISFLEAGVYPFAAERDGTPRPGLASREIFAAPREGGRGPHRAGAGRRSDRAAARAARARGRRGSRSLGDRRPRFDGTLGRDRCAGASRRRAWCMPHPGEMATLAGLPIEAVTADPQSVAADAAAHLGCTVVLKGTTTVIAQPQACCYLHEGDCVGL